MARDIYRHVTGIKTVAVPEDFFDKTFIRHLILGTGETPTKNEGVHASTKTSRNSASRAHGTRVTRIFTHMGQ